MVVKTFIYRFSVDRAAHSLEAGRKMDKKLFLFVFIFASVAALQSFSFAATDPVGTIELAFPLPFSIIAFVRARLPHFPLFGLKILVNGLVRAHRSESLTKSVSRIAGRMVWVDGPSAGDTAGQYSSGGPISARNLPGAS